MEKSWPSSSTLANDVDWNIPSAKVLYETAGWIGHPRISPKGDLIAFLDHQIVDDDRGSVAVVDMAGNKRVLSSEWGTEQGLAWAPDGKEVWFTANKSGEAQALYAVDLSARRAGRRAGAHWYLCSMTFLRRAGTVDARQFYDRSHRAGPK